MTLDETGDAGPIDALEAAWRRSDEIFATLKPEAMLARPIPLRQPFLFYVGHLAAFAWNHLWRRVAGWRPFDDELDGLFERGIDPPDDGDGPADEADAWPALEAVLAYRNRVRACLKACVDEPGVRETLPMVLEHELIHHETLLYMVQELPAAWKTPPAEVVLAPDPKGGGSDRVPIHIPGGRVILGAGRNGRFRWDNEFPQVTVDVAPFQIDALPVTNGELRSFVEAGGYEDRRLWSDDAWDWICRRDHRRPWSWTAAEGDPKVKTAFGERPFGDAADWPASVMHCEAVAFARSEGARLPTEAEFHRAAFGSPDGTPREHPWGDASPASQANLGLRHWSSVPVASYPEGASAFGVHELVGNGWEWTSTAFGPFPGFEPLQGYEGYSADFFDDRHFVMLGGSWATDEGLVRRSFRNWFQPHYPYTFSKFRCVRDE